VLGVTSRQLVGLNLAEGICCLHEPAELHFTGEIGRADHDVGKNDSGL
jgi:hypothetical protein